MARMWTEMDENRAEAFGHGFDEFIEGAVDIVVIVTTADASTKYLLPHDIQHIDSLIGGLEALKFDILSAFPSQ